MNFIINSFQIEMGELGEVKGDVDPQVPPVILQVKGNSFLSLVWSSWSSFSGKISDLSALTFNPDTSWYSSKVLIVAGRDVSGSPTYRTMSSAKRLMVCLLFLIWTPLNSFRFRKASASGSIAKRTIREPEGSPAVSL